MAADSPATPVLPPPVVCEHCGYDLAGIKVAADPVTCPECGKTAVCIPKPRANGGDYVIGILPMVISLTAALLWPSGPDGAVFAAAAALMLLGPLVAGLRLRVRLSGSERCTAVAQWFVLRVLLVNNAILVALGVVYVALG